MGNFIPYFVLILVFTPLVIWTLTFRGEKGLITVFFTYVGMIYVVEFLILVVCNSYRYKPLVLSVPYYDNILGAVISDMVAVPAIALVAAVFRLGNLWCLSLAAAFGGIEWLFVRLGVYESYWWTVLYTVVLFTIFFVFARFWLRKIREKYRPSIHFLSLFLPSFTFVATILFVSGVLNLHLDHVGVFTDKFRDSVFIASIYGAVESLAFTAAQFWFPKNLWWNLGAVLYSIALEYALEQHGVIDIFVQAWVYYVAQLGCSFLVVVFLFYLNRWLMQLSSSKVPGIV